MISRFGRIPSLASYKSLFPLVSSSDPAVACKAYKLVVAGLRVDLPKTMATQDHEASSEPPSAQLRVENPRGELVQNV